MSAVYQIGGARRPDRHPLPPPPRYDVARALAVWGMVAEHFALVMAAAPWQPTWLAAAAGFPRRPARGDLRRPGRLRPQPAKPRAGGPRRRAPNASPAGDCSCLPPASSTSSSGPATSFGSTVSVCFLASQFLTPRPAGCGSSPSRSPSASSLLCGVLDYEAHWEWQTLNLPRSVDARGRRPHLFFDGFPQASSRGSGCSSSGCGSGRRVTDDRMARRRIGLTAAAVALVRRRLSRPPRCGRS